jgi:hypothetical protein
LKWYYTESFWTIFKNIDGILSVFGSLYTVARALIETASPELEKQSFLAVVFVCREYSEQ